MSYEALTAEQKLAVDALSDAVRPLAGTLARTLEKFQAVNSYWTGNVETILAGLQSSDVIPNKTGLAGAQGLTKSQLTTLVGYMITASATADGAVSSYNTNFHRSLYAQAAGPVNLMNE